MGDQPRSTAPDARWIVSAQEQAGPVRIKEEEIPLQIGADSGASRGSARRVTVGEEEERPARIKEEEFQIEIDISDFSNQNPAASAAHPLYSQESSSGNQNIPQGYQESHPGYLEVKLESGEMYVSSAGQFKQEEMTLEIGQDGSYNQDCAQRSSQSSTPVHPGAPHSCQVGNSVKTEMKEEQMPSQISMGFQTENQSSQMNATDPLEGRSMDPHIYEYEDEMPDEEYSYSIDSESDDRFTDESEETDDSDDLSPSPPRQLSESTERFLAMLQEQVCPSHLPEPYCFQNDPMCTTDEPRSPQVKEENLVGHTEWCECGKCQPMPANSDCLCCRKVENIEEHLLGGLMCVTMSEEFHNRCLNEKVLRYLLEYDRSTTRRDYVADKNRCLRRAAYRSYTRMIHGFRKKRAFVRIPSCVVCAVRERFPDPKPYNHISLDYPASYVAMSVVERG